MGGSEVRVWRNSQSPSSRLENIFVSSPVKIEEGVKVEEGASVKEPGEPTEPEKETSPTAVPAPAENEVQVEVSLHQAFPSLR